jgi:hypothetical protein
MVDGQGQGRYPEFPPPPFSPTPAEQESSKVLPAEPSFNFETDHKLPALLDVVFHNGS